LTDAGKGKPSAVDFNSLRRFAWLVATVLAVVFGALLPWLRGRSVPQWPWWPWIAASVTFLWGWLHPRSLRGPFSLWMLVAKGFARINNRVILAIVFFGLLWPLGATLRILGRNPLARGFKEKTPSYRLKSQPRSRDHMEKSY
jgi:Saxitoxin biosynthesis operon protein SxtJ